MLNDLETQYRAAGINVRRDHAEADLRAVTARGVVLVDDAHELSEATITRIHSLIDEPDVNLVVAYRLWPQPPALGRLIAALERHHPPIMLGPLSHDDIAATAAAALDGPVPVAFVDRVSVLTGGMPWLVHSIMSAVRRDGRGATVSEPLITHDVLHELDFELDRIHNDLRDLLIALAVGFELSGRMPPLLEQAGHSIDDLVSRAQAAGLLLADGGLVPLVRQALLATTPAHRMRALRLAFIDTLPADGRSLSDAARALARDGFKDPHLALALERAGDRALAAQPALASALYDEATRAGSDELTTAARRAQAACAEGDFDDADRVLDGLLADKEAPDVTRAVDVSAMVWARRGMLARGAEAYRWLEPANAGFSAALAAVAMIGTGDREGADAMLKVSTPSGSPTLLSVAVTLMGQGIRESIDSCPDDALSSLIRASDMMTASGITTVPLPETPAALAALLALHSGELDVADSIIAAALAGNQGGQVAAPRLLLLRAWAAMQRDRPDQVRAAITQAKVRDGQLAPRDQLLLHALEVGLARRADDGHALVRAWRAAREGILHVSVDLYSLLPLGELVVAAARLRDSRWLEPHVAQAWTLLSRLGDPSLWSVHLHWSAVQAGILAERPQDLGTHASALVRASEHNHLAAILAAAGRRWMSVLSGDVDAVAVESAARGLASVGLTWDGARLAGHASVRTAERRDMARLLACARDLHPSPPASGPTSVSPSTPASAVDPNPSRATAGESEGKTNSAMGLSDRERDVARMVLEGKTYREIGEALFISPRTAEHHIGQVRRRFRITTRSQLLSQLRHELEAGVNAPTSGPNP